MVTGIKCSDTVNCKLCNRPFKPWRLSQDLVEKLGNHCHDPTCAWDSNVKLLPTLEIDHIDGNSTNNFPSNLRLLCPNCHALTPTYKNKNKGNGRHARRTRYKEGKSY